ncbi:MAG: translation initiation factor [Salinivirgaceae bacterium]|nr:translation initiation factor [Salinivirgaceae bacterium]MDD4746335.1 translation initiation factor [Salinivirgaceae bacterium]MDY0280364.1 translation initiation factor [Salinivirgaceae bacterium]
MAKQSKKNDGIMFSTNPDFQIENQYEELEPETVPNKQQDLRVSLDKKQRKGKKVTLITGFKGGQEDLDKLGKLLKSKCGVGGTSKDGEIMIQGDFVEKTIVILLEQGYKAKRKGG